MRARFSPTEKCVADMRTWLQANRELRTSKTAAPTITKNQTKSVRNSAGQAQLHSHCQQRRANCLGCEFFHSLQRLLGVVAYLEPVELLMLLFFAQLSGSCAQRDCEVSSMSLAQIHAVHVSFQLCSIHYNRGGTWAILWTSNKCGLSKSLRRVRLLCRLFQPLANR